QRLKRVGRAARVELEQLLGRKVYLELFVKTREGWQDREEVRRLIDWRQGSV
ncbi:MAG: GTPase Era, partial [Acidobacteria bacterium]|nr:GTPase Era [Acidobacteriota bacterium]